MKKLTSNVTLILSERFSQNILENEKCFSLITSTCHSFDKKYNSFKEKVKLDEMFEQVKLLGRKRNLEKGKKTNYKRDVLF